MPTYNVGIYFSKVTFVRSFFWRIFLSFWLAITITVSLTILFSHFFNQDTWILNRLPIVKNVAQQWVDHYENEGIESARKFLQQHQSKYRVDIQILTESGTALVTPRHHRMMRGNGNFSHNLPPPTGPMPQWRQITQEYTSTKTGNSYLFIFRIPNSELNAWQRESIWRPVSGITITLIVLTIFSILLTLSITRPLKKLRGAVHDLGRTEYQKNSLANLANRKDEFGLLAKDFSLMGEHLQALIDSQRQLLRDVSHELRSPLTRLKLTTALLERANDEDREKLSKRLSLECDRLESLISEILTLARLDSVPGNKTTIPLAPLLKKLQEDAKITAPDQQIKLTVPETITINGWEDRLERALDNLIRNALRFNPTDKPIEITAQQEANKTHITIRDYGVGVTEEHLAQLSKPFYRVPGQTSQGYGLGLAISRRAIESHNGQITFSNHPEGGFLVKIILPTNSN